LRIRGDGQCPSVRRRFFLDMDLTKALNLDKVSRFEGEMNGEKFWFEAKEEMLTPAFLNTLKEWESDHLGCAEQMAKVIVAWDVELDGKPYPPTAENLANVPKKFLTHCLNIIVESWQGNPPKPSESASS
jgi:hypothetical protein